MVLAAVAGAWLAALGAPTTPAAVAAAVEENRVAVVVDTGTEVKSVCVRFREESISGVEALARAAVDPVFRAFPGKGAAVCSLCGTGCPADDSCLTCDSQGRFWSYSRAAGGAPGLRPSGVGASSTTVRDGDVEGWRWGLGGSPPFATVAQVCGDVVVPVATSTTGPSAAGPGPAPTTGTTAATATPRTTAATPAAGPAASPGSALGAATAPSTPVPPAPQPAASPSVPPAATPMTAVPTGPADQPDLALARNRRDHGRSGWPGLAGFGAVLAGLLVWSALARRRRRAQPSA